MFAFIHSFVRSFSYVIFLADAAPGGIPDANPPVARSAETRRPSAGRPGLSDFGRPEEWHHCGLRVFAPSELVFVGFGCL